MRIAFTGPVAVVLALTTRPVSAQANHQHPKPTRSGPLGIPDTRSGSGTSWVPDATPMHAAHFVAGSWALMLHGEGFLQYNRQGGARGDAQVDLIDWAMLSATRDLGAGRLQLRGMLSTDPWGVGGGGYPLLLQTGEANHGQPLVDHQHPHDLFMELAALYERPLTAAVGLSVYLAPVGEPAVGPVAFPHRPSAMNDPLAPIGHHWQDGTHITFGVATLGVFTPAAKLEASIFNGREPDERRANFDYAGRRLDSYAARLTVNPQARWSLSAWLAYLRSPEGLHPEESLHRLGVSALTVRPIGTRGAWAGALILGVNRPIGSGRSTNSVMLESNLDLDGTNAVFGRVEFVQKSARELVIPSVASGTSYDIGAAVVGYHRGVLTRLGTRLGVGVRGSVNFVPAALQSTYGSRNPFGLLLYVSVGPA
ncbi:MAG TPA: hypothetical protein VJ816_02400 [Gemmatimonadales bacterium]|nr:hypothetical protein [Gemmatimonadales bacterium]